MCFCMIEWHIIQFLKGNLFEMEATSLTLRLRDSSEIVFKESSKAGDLQSLIDSVRTVQRLSNERLSEVVEQEKSSEDSGRQASEPSGDANNDYSSGSDEDGGT